MFNAGSTPLHQFVLIMVVSGLTLSYTSNTLLIGTSRLVWSFSVTGRQFKALAYLSFNMLANRCAKFFEGSTNEGLPTYQYLYQLGPVLTGITYNEVIKFQNFSRRGFWDCLHAYHYAQRIQTRPLTFPFQFVLYLTIFRSYGDHKCVTNRKLQFHEGRLNRFSSRIFFLGLRIDEFGEHFSKQCFL